MRKTAWLAMAMMVVAMGAMAQPRVAVPVYGNWHGEFTTSDWKDKSVRAEIIGESNDTYRVQLYVADKGGEPVKAVVKGKTDAKTKKTPFQGNIDLGAKLGGDYLLVGEAFQGEFKGWLKGGNDVEFLLKRVQIQSPTLGAKPPQGAVVLLYGEEQPLDLRQKAFHDNWSIPFRWTMNNQGAIQIAGGSIISNQQFGDAEYHIEFKTPYMPNDRGQARGNSGVYINGKYEIQVLDSFGDKPENNLCGGIYQQAVPLTNACLPPNEWQTYDITFIAPKLGADGNVAESAILTVKHNGILIHDHLKLKSSPGGIGGKESSMGPLLFQDHSDRVSFRNVWVKPLG